MRDGEPDSVAAQLLKFAKALGADFIFSNLGSDHPAFIQAFAEFDEGERIPEIICCPHEMTALSAAHGYSMITRRPQLVLVHVDVGTQNLGCSVHNIARARVPAIIIAGLSPLTADGTRRGDRTEFIHYLQDVPAQSEIVRQYMKWTYELRAAETVHHVFLRGHQLASTLPQGPVYITGAREVWEEALSLPLPSPQPPARLGGMPPEAVERLLGALARAERPLIITTYLGQSAPAVEALVVLSERLALPVQEVTPHCVNFPGDHPHHAGYARDRHVADADFILVLEADVPWLPRNTGPAAGVPVFLLDADPLKQDIALWHFPVNESYQVDTEVALAQLLAQSEPPPPRVLEARRSWIEQIHPAGVAAPAPADGSITPQLLSTTLAQLIDDDCIVLSEAPSSTPAILPALRPRRPGAFFTSGGSGLGWGINAAIGAKLARPESTVIALVGDGCYLFGVPSSTYWVAKHYDTPTLTIIYNNGGWNSPKRSSDLVHQDGGLAGQADSYWITVNRDARLAQVAAAVGDAVAFEVRDPEQLGDVLRQALRTVRNGRCAVVDVALQAISQQKLGRRTHRRRTMNTDKQEV